MGRVVGIGGSLPLLGSFGGGSAGIFYDSTTGAWDYYGSVSGGVSPGYGSLDVIVGKTGGQITDFTGIGYEASIAFGAQAGLLFNSQGKVVGVITGLG